MGLADTAIRGAIARVAQISAFVVVKLLIPTVAEDLAACTSD